MNSLQSSADACKILLAAGMMVVGGAVEAFAQQQVTTQDGISVPRGMLQVREIAYSAWQKSCFKVPTSESICRTSTTGKMNTGQTIIRVDLIDSGEKSATRLQLLLPPVFYIPAGIKIRVGTEEAEIPFLACVSNGCLAAGRLDERLLAQMRPPTQMSIEGVNVSLLSVGAAIPLDTFPIAHEGPPARTFDEALEENQ